MRFKFLSRLRDSVPSTRGAVDLASIMVGVIVIGIISGVIAAAVFGVIPWSQDKAAQTSLGAVNTAEAAFRGMHDGERYGTLDDLYAAKLLVGRGDVSVVTDATGSCWVAIKSSATGKRFWAESSDTRARELKAGDAPVCTGFPAEELLVHSPTELAAAFADGPSGAVVRVAKDWKGSSDDTQVGVPVGKAFTLDLDGHVISLAGTGDDWDVATAGIALPEGADLTVMSTRVGGELHVTGGPQAAAIGTSGSPGAFSCDDSELTFGAFHLLSGKVVALSGKRAPAVGPLCSQAGGLIDIQGGALTATGSSETLDQPAVGAWSGHVKIKVSGGKLLAFDSGMIGAIALGQARSGHMEVTGGEVIATALGDGAGVCVNDTFAAQLSISGGSVTASASPRAGAAGIGGSPYCAGGPAIVQISGGTVTTTNGANYSQPEVEYRISGHPVINGHAY